MEIVGIIAGVPGLIQIIQAVTTAVRGVSKKDVAPKVAQNLIQSLQNVEKILRRGKEERLWDERQFDQHKSTIELWTNELASLNDALQPSNLKKETRRSLKKFCLILTELEKRLNEWSTRLSQIQIELILIMTDVQQHVMRRILHETVTARLRADLHPCSVNFIPDKTPGTCEWIWSQSTFCDWIEASSTTPDSDLKRTLCVYGIKGSGKSVLTKAAAERLEEQGQIALHFSFWSGNENQRKLEDLLRTLVWQTLRIITDVDLEKVSKLLTGSDGIDKRSLVEAFRIALFGINQKVYCTIDGIDESSEDWNSDTDGCLSTILDLVKNHTNFHVLLTGREASMRTLLKRAIPRLEITEHLIRSDIEKLVAVEIHDSLRSYSPVTRAEAQKELVAGTQNMFLWVTLVLKELRRCSSIEDVRQTLEQIPRNLDREYHRLFFQLMTRTGGSRAKPSISMKRARYIFFSILACPEPMTGEDLCYAYATQVNTSGRIEDDLITIDGILDACGDFVRVTEGRYHIIHASTSDFLMRPQSEWELEDTDISYFRIDLTEVQGSMSLACFKYVRSIDLGYPLTDGGASSLSSKYSFFSYVARYLPFHVAEALEENEQVSLETSNFVRTHHFCALVEYILATSQNSPQTGFLEFMCHWVGIFASTRIELDQAFKLELDRRERDFGAQDERYQSWLALACLMPGNTQKLSALQNQSLKRLAHNRGMIAKIKGNAISLLPQHIGNAHEPILQRVSGSLQSLSRIFATFRSTATDLLAASAESMPVPLLLLASRAAKVQGNWLLAEKIDVISVRKTRGKGDFLEMCNLLSLGSARYYVNKDISETTEEMVRESVRIANRLPDQLHVQMLKMEALRIMILMLLQQRRKGDADEFIHMYEDLIGRHRKKTSNRVWEYSLCHTRFGTTYRVHNLCYTARKLFAKKSFTLSADFAAQGIAILANSQLKASEQDLGLFITHRSALFKAGELNQCISSCQQLLSFSAKLASGPFVTNARWITQLLGARCHANQGDVIEADKWFCEAVDEIDRMGPDKRHPNGQTWYRFMVEDLALLGQYKFCQWITRRILKTKGISYSDDQEDLGFGFLEPLALKLKDIQSIDSNYTEFLRCYSLSIAERKLLGRAEKADWLKGELRLINNNIQSFSKRIPLLQLKYIDTCLGQDNGLLNALEGYKSLGRYFFLRGDTEAADLVSSDAESRIFSHLSPKTLKLASDVYFYAGRFSRCYTFEMEMFYASTCIRKLEGFEEYLEKADLRLLFLGKACEHLSNALRARIEIEWDEDTRSEDDQSGDAHDAGKKRKERITDLETRLEDLDGGSMLTEVVARTGAGVLCGVRVEFATNKHQYS
ncbi:tetratricopeptide-like helical [Fusarium pseudocircinatum]|uniref:Tetratricopeptide-like helical n=1 Tax=Fusarium pseudocircinatum TaxID=56676 RepID=A0A8H5L4E4_9HYPO|nr:tetratricopeptide-like helical [Fusarium pseudocircinatum]